MERVISYLVILYPGKIYIFFKYFYNISSKDFLITYTLFCVTCCIDVKLDNVVVSLQAIPVLFGVKM